MQQHIIKSLLFSAYSLHLICFQRCSSPFQGSLSKVHRTFFTLALGAMLIVSCSKEEPNEGSVNPTPGQETVSFVGTHWEALLDFNDIIAGSEIHFVYNMTMEFFTDSTGRMMQTMLEPYSFDPAPFDFVYQFDGETSGSMTEFNMYGEQLETLRITYDKVSETITVSNDNYTPEQHAKFDRVFHKVNNNVE